MNTTWVYGLVFFTGQDTKLIRNSRNAPAKRSQLDKGESSFHVLTWVLTLID